MSKATVTTTSGGIFVINDAFMVTQDVIFGQVGGQDYRYDVVEGDRVVFSS